MLGTGKTCLIRGSDTAHLMKVFGASGLNLAAVAVIIYLADFSDIANSFLMGAV